MDPEEFFVKVLKHCPELVQPSWVPQKSTKATRPSIIATKFGGCSPWVSDDWKWPKCRVCDNPTSFLLQINLAEIPLEFKLRMNLSDGLFQLFDCIGCFKYNHGAWGSARIVPREDINVVSLQNLAAAASKDLAVTQLPSKLQKYVHEIQNPSENHPHWDTKTPLKVFQEMFVVNWKRNSILEIPDNDEWDLLESARDKLGMDAEDIQDIDYINLENRNYKVNEDGEEIKIGGPSQVTKVGGWLDWYSSLGYPGYPKCSKCPDNPLMKNVFLQLNISDLFDEDTLSRCLQFQSNDYPEIIFVSLCPTCQNPALFESFPPPLEPPPFDPNDYYEINES